MSSPEWNFPQPYAPHSSRRHAAERGSPESPWLLIFVVLLVLALLAVGLWWVFLRPAPSGTSIGGGSSCKGELVAVKVVVDHAVEDVVNKAAHQVFNEGDGCDKFDLISEDSAQLANKLSSPDPTKDDEQQTALSDIWIPASSGWLGQANRGPIKRFPMEGYRSVARSPLVLVMPDEQVAQQALTVAAQVRQKQAELMGKSAVAGQGSSGDQAATVARTWSPYILAASPEKEAPFHLAAPDARTTTAGMLTVVSLPQTFRSFSTDPGVREMLTKRVKWIMESNNKTSDELFQGLKEGSKTAFVALENDVWKFAQNNAKENKTVPLSVVYPTDTVAVADYPLVTATDASPPKADLARRLGDKLTSMQMNADWVEKGLRPATGGDRPNSPAFQPQPLSAAPANMVQADPAETAAQVADWANYTQAPFNVLVLIDQSGSMNGKVQVEGVEKTKADLLREAGFVAGQLFGTDTTLGIWLFGLPDDSRPYMEVLPFKQMDQKLDSGITQRDQVGVLLRDFKAIENTSTPLFRTSLDGIKYMQQHVSDEALTIVVVLTDGTDEASQFSMELEEYLEEYKKIHDDKRGVVLFPIAFGDKADVEALRAMAAQTLPPEFRGVFDTVSVAERDTDLASAIAKVFNIVRSEEVTKLRQSRAAAAG